MPLVSSLERIETISSAMNLSAVTVKAVLGIVEESLKTTI